MEKSKNKNVGKVAKPTPATSPTGNVITLHGLMKEVLGDNAPRYYNALGDSGKSLRDRFRATWAKGTGEHFHGHAHGGAWIFAGKPDIEKARAIIEAYAAGKTVAARVMGGIEK